MRFLSLNMYLGIFETEMTHVVVDQAEAKAPVHDGQAPLWRESLVSINTAKVYAIVENYDKTNILKTQINP